MITFVNIDVCQLPTHFGKTSIIDRKLAFKNEGLIFQLGREVKTSSYNFGSLKNVYSFIIKYVRKRCRFC